MGAPPIDLAAVIAAELNLSPKAVRAVVSLLEEGATVPFIARYRKEATSGLDEVAIRDIRDRRSYLQELGGRRQKILEEIRKQNKLTPQLLAAIESAKTKSELEDLYAPFKSKRRTRAVMAKERGLQPLAEKMWGQPSDGSPRRSADAFVSSERDVADSDAALAGARDICAERVADHADVRRLVREIYTRHAHLSVRKTKAHRQDRTKFDDYDNYQEQVRNIASHRYLAIRRGENEGVLKVAVKLDDEERLLGRIERIVGVERRSPWAGELRLAVEDGYGRLLSSRAAAELRSEQKQAAERTAVHVFARNLAELLLAAPYGAKSVLGIDPGQRTGCKCVIVSKTGALIAHETIYLVHGDNKLADARTAVERLCREHAVSAVAVGNGTHGRETEAFVREVLAKAAVDALVVSVSEAGASIYSASDIAREEFPDIDLTIRGAVSIARRLQDPLAELVKLDPKSIGVGQYQHDVQASMLSDKLDEVVEDCVNGVGVNLNTASAPLLGRVAGLGPKLAKSVVAERHARGGFRSRKQLLKVPGLGSKTYQQAAGFLRIQDGEHPLDASAVHPERYALVQRMAKDVGVDVRALVGNEDKVSELDPSAYLDGEVGSYTVDDILTELRKPGRDPRATFSPPKFRDDVRTMNDLREGMQLEGVVTNVTSFGAFVDIGVKQDGLVHVSQLADRFVKDPNDVVHVGSKVSVRVLSVDLERKRISLSARKDAGSPSPQDRSRGDRPRGDRPRGDSRQAPRHDARQAPRHDARPERQERGSFENRPFAKGLSKKRR